MERILIVRLGAMGDVVHALPAVTALRAAFPSATIGWAIEERWSELLCAAEDCEQRGPQMPLVDAIHFVNTRAWRSAPLADGTWEDIRGTFRSMREMKYDVVLDFQGAMKSAAVASFSGADRRVGNARPWERTAAMFYSHPVEVKSAHVVEQALEIASSVAGKHLHYLPPLLPCDGKDEQWAEQELARRNLKDFVLITPGAGWGAKQWPAKRYAEVAVELENLGYFTLINHGPAERELANEVVRESDGAAAPIDCSISELIELTRRARLVIGGDTGPIHLAAALEVPIVALYGPTDPKRTGPFGTRAIVLRRPESRTSHARRSATEAGLASITSAEVLQAARSLLEESRGA